MDGELCEITLMPSEIVGWNRYRGWAKRNERDGSDPDMLFWWER